MFQLDWSGFIHATVVNLHEGKSAYGRVKGRSEVGVAVAGIARRRSWRSRRSRSQISRSSRRSASSGSSGRINA